MKFCEKDGQKIRGEPKIDSGRDIHNEIHFRCSSFAKPLKLYSLSLFRSLFLSNVASCKMIADEILTVKLQIIDNSCNLRKKSRNIEKLFVGNRYDISRGLKFSV